MTLVYHVFFPTALRPALASTKEFATRPRVGPGLRGILIAGSHGLQDAQLLEVVQPPPAIKADGRRRMYRECTVKT